MEHTEHPQFADLPALLKKQRRCVAAQIRISTEDREHRTAMLAMLDAVGVDEVTCDGYRIWRGTDRHGEPTANVRPIR